MKLKPDAGKTCDGWGGHLPIILTADEAIFISLKFPGDTWCQCLKTYFSSSTATNPLDYFFHRRCKNGKNV
jgi:hypothetical protein